MTASPITPPIRWAGSKREYATDLAARCTAALAPDGRYIEPFLGSGAVALAMPPGTSMILGDRAMPLGYLWWWIRQEPAALAEYAIGYGTECKADGSTWNTRPGFLALRKEHNAEPFSADDFRPSARFLWILHACFNGIYRENQKGQFNVPWGARMRMSVPGVDHLTSIATHFDTADIRPGWDFEDVMAEAADGDVIFVDPPYDGDKSAFTSYVKSNVHDMWSGSKAQAQARLAAAANAAVDRGATVVMTNADTPRIRELYTGWSFDTVAERRAVAADATKRSPAYCLVVTSPGGRS